MGEDRFSLDLVVRRAGESGCRAWVIVRRGEEEMAYGPYAIHGSFDPLERLAARPGEYSRGLGEIFYTGSELGDVLQWGMCALREPAGDGDGATTSLEPLPVHLRLCIEPFNSSLQRLRWELLGGQSGGLPFSAQTGVIFSRLVEPARPEDQPVLRRRDPRSCLRALFAAPTPDNLPRMGLVPVQIRDELARSGLNRIMCEIFPARANGSRPVGRCTLAGLSERLRFGPGARPFDLLYLTCHARFDQQQPRLFFEDPYGGTQVVTGSELANRLDGVCPRLVVLVHPPSTDPSAAQGLLALGPMLTRAGTGAVLVLPGEPAPGLLPAFMRRFLDELGQNAQIDLAAARARQALLGSRQALLRAASGWWQPVLFISRRDGLLWDSDQPPSSVDEQVLSGPPHPY